MVTVMIAFWFTFFGSLLYVLNMWHQGELQGEHMVEGLWEKTTLRQSPLGSHWRKSMSRLHRLQV